MKSIYGDKLDECKELNEWFERVKKEVIIIIIIISFNLI